MSFKVRFLPDNIAARAGAGESLLKAAAGAGIILRGACGGAGTCGRCRVTVLEGEVRGDGARDHGGPDRTVPACRTYPASDLVVEIPPESRFTEHRVLMEEQRREGLPAEAGAEPAPGGPLYAEYELELAPPDRADPGDDLGRLKQGLARATGGPEPAVPARLVRGLPARLRALDWRLHCGVAHGHEVPRLVEIRAPGSAAAPGLAVDLGTTTVVAQLVDPETGDIIGTRGTYNRQAAFGDDVISRIIYAVEEPGGREALRAKALETINGLVAELAAACGVDPRAVKSCACAGNPTMVHLLLGVDPTHLRLEPYVPAANAWPVFTAAEADLDIFPDAPVYLLPGVASYIGGDITGGLVSSGAAAGDAVTLFVDIGTNGEMVLGNREWLIGCACSAGPSFEGVGLSCGMRAAAGAVERVSVSRGGFEVLAGVIGDGKPVGLCGSGLISALAALLRAGVIDRAGRFAAGLETPRLRAGRDGREFVLVWGAESGHGRDIVLTAADIQTLLRAKAAVFAGIRTLLHAVGGDLGMVDRVLVAGGFGRHLDIGETVAIGMLPDVPAAKFRFVGNSALGGARRALISAAARGMIEETARRITNLELDETTPFMDEFVAAMFIPHTEAGLFPSVAERE